MQCLPSILDYRVSEQKNPVITLNFCSTHGISPSNSVFHAKLARKPAVLRFNRLFFAITRLLNAQATNRR